jgi:hypothetical protein
MVSNMKADLVSKPAAGDARQGNARFAEYKTGADRAVGPEEV